MLRSRKVYGSRGERSTEDFMSEIEDLRQKLKRYKDAAADHPIEIALVEAEVAELQQEVAAKNKQIAAL